MIKKHSKLKMVGLIMAILCLMVLIFFLVGKSFGFFQYAKQGEAVNVISIKGLAVNVDETTVDSLNITNTFPMSDSDGLEQSAFIFTINNTSSKAMDYSLKLLNDDEKQSACFTDSLETNPCTLLPYQYIKYSYSINDGEYSNPANLTEDGVIYSETISGNGEAKIAIKLWIDSEAPNSIQGNTFFGKLLLTGEKVPDPVYSFATDSWDTILTNIRNNNGSVYAPTDAGSQNQVVRAVTLNYDGVEETHYLRVANTTSCSDALIENPKLTSETACGFVIEFADIIGRSSFNSTQNGVGGYPSSILFDYVTNTLYNALPDEIKNLIIDTTVISSHQLRDTNPNGEGRDANSNFVTPNQKLYLFDRQEVYGDNSRWNTAASTTRQLDYYRLNDYTNYVKYYTSNGVSSREAWYLRSIAGNSEGISHWVDTFGNIGANSTAGIRGVSPAFRIG